MFIKQISIFLENAKGSLAGVTRVLKQSGIDLVGVSVADTKDFGILRGIVSDTDRAYAAVREAGYTASLTDVLAVCVEDRPGGLADVLAVLEDADISVEYMYSFVRRAGEHALVILRVEDPQCALKALEKSGVRLLSAGEVFSL